MKSALTKLSLALLLSALLMSCATPAQPLPMNFSDQLREVRADQKAADCAKWKNDPLPEHIVKEIDLALAAKVDRTVEQKALADWFEIARRDVTERQGYCGA